MTVRLVPMLLSAALVSSCAAAADGTEYDGSSSPKVVASAYPLAYVADRVGGEHVHLTNLTSQGADPHAAELGPQQVGAVQEADLVVFESGFQAAVDRAVEHAGQDTTRVDTAELVDLRKPQVAGEPAPDGHEHEGHEHEGHGHAVDPHIWLDPQNMVTITRAVAERLGDLDAQHATAYEENAAALVADLRRLDGAFRRGLRQCDQHTIVTSHAAFGYLTSAYRLHQVPIAGIEPSSQPTAAQLADVVDTVRAEGITTVFAGRLSSSSAARTVADETGASVATLDPIESLSDATADESYLSLMRQNLHTIQKANDCS